MAVKVVDASAIAALLFGEPEAEDVAKRLGDSRLVAPTLLAFELANVFVVKCRKHPELSATLAEAFGLRRHLAIEEIPMNHDEIVATAQSAQLTAYDASYLCLARQLRAELVTLDRRLANASVSPAAHRTPRALRTRPRKPR